MNEKKHTTEHTDRPEPWEQSFYQTGSTRPPKSRRGIVAVLLILVIFLCSLVHIQSLVNIRLFRQLSSQEEEASSVRFVRSLPIATQESEQTVSDTATVSGLGLEGSVLSSFDQQFYELPQGVYITEVDPRSDAALKGICPGDVLVSIDGVSLTDANVIAAQLDACEPGDTVIVIIYRGGIRQPVTLTMEEE